MSKTKLIQSVVEQTQWIKKDVSKAVDSIFQAIEQSLSQGEEVSMVGFGAFRVFQKKERKGRNPRTGDPVTIPATKVVRFSAGKNLKEAINS